MIEKCSDCGHSYRNHGIDGCYFQYYNEYGTRIGECSCKRNEFDEYNIIQKKLEMAMEALKGISSLWHGRGLAPKVLEELDKTIAEIEKIK
jgi:hypothetical protein